LAIELAKRNLFILLSFLGIVFLGLVMLGFWYLAEPRLREVYRHLPMIVGLALLGAYLVVVGLFTLIVLSSRFKRDWISAKKITVRILFPLASALGRLLRVEPDAIRSSFIQINNSLVKASARLVSGDRLLLLLPHCLQNFECPHRVTSEARNCRHCGGCEIASLIDVCDARGVKMSIATGGTLARRVIVETRPMAIVAVACERDLTSGIQDSYPIPVIGVLNERPFGPCRNTRVSLSDVRRAIDFFLGPETAPAGPEADKADGEAPNGALEPKKIAGSDDRGVRAAHGGRSGNTVGS
jgi:hypothetical protein